jgi:sulfonate transport system substrate-binding protein
LSPRLSSPRTPTRTNFASVYSEAAAQLAPIQGLDAGVIEAGLRHYAHIYKPVDANVLAEQQRIADTFSELHIIPTRIVTKDAALPEKA